MPPFQHDAPRINLKQSTTIGAVPPNISFISQEDWFLRNHTEPRMDTNTHGL
jgi:hypothetical protein